MLLLGAKGKFSPNGFCSCHRLLCHTQTLDKLIDTNSTVLFTANCCSLSANAVAAFCTSLSFTQFACYSMPQLGQMSSGSDTSTYSCPVQFSHCFSPNAGTDLLDPATAAMNIAKYKPLRFISACDSLFSSCLCHPQEIFSLLCACLSVYPEIRQGVRECKQTHADKCTVQQRVVLDINAESVDLEAIPLQSCRCELQG